MESIVYNEDCMIGMARYQDKYFDLAVVDPPYGIGVGKMNLGKGGGVAKSKNYKKKDWDKEPPTNEYWNALWRVSKNQIVWGGNYYNLPISKGWIVWQKFIDLTIKNDYSPFELAWSSFSKPAMYQFLWNGFWQGDMKNKEQRIHPSQKPIQLYSWIYKNYLPEGGKVIDTHLGSGSNRIAADKAGNIDFVGFEIDKDYFEAQEKRWKQYKAQLTLF